MNDNEPHVLIAGAGLAGALLACMLGRRGYRVTLYERRPDPRVAGFIGGRSINLALSARGLNALSRVDLDSMVLEDAIPMHGRMIHPVAGECDFQPYSKNPADAINSVSRGALNMTLLAAADQYDNVSIEFGWRCVDADLDAAAAQFVHYETGGDLRVEGDVLIGADGAFSAVRGAMQRTAGFDYSQSYLAHGYRELAMPPADDGDFAIEPNALHIWPRGGSMMIALPNTDRTFTCTLFWPLSGPGGLDSLTTEESIRAHFADQYADAVPLLKDLVKDYTTNPVGRLVTVRCNPWHHGKTALLLGDSAHAIVPFYGQGMNAAFEDCLALDDLLEEHGPDWARVLPAYSAARRENGDAIADMALTNFVEMRDRVKSPTFRLWKKIEKVIHRFAHRWYTPLYNLVSFSTMPYAAALRRSQVQVRVLQAIAAAVSLLLLLLLYIIIF